MSGLFAGTPLERPVTCETCGQTLDACACPRDAHGNVLLPSDQIVRVTKQKRARGKIVTVVAGLDRDANDLGDLLSTLKKRCGAGGTTTDDGVEIQGDHRQTVTAALAALGFAVQA